MRGLSRAGGCPPAPASHFPRRPSPAAAPGDTRGCPGPPAVPAPSAWGSWSSDGRAGGSRPAAVVLRARVMASEVSKWKVLGRLFSLAWEFYVQMRAFLRIPTPSLPVGGAVREAVPLSRGRIAGGAQPGCVPAAGNSPRGTPSDTLVSHVCRRDVRGSGALGSQLHPGT